MEKNKTLFIIVPCYNEADCLPSSKPLLKETLERMMREKLISDKSRILFIDDGSEDATWELIRRFCAEDPICAGLKLSPNGGHQKALMAGIMEAVDRADISISIDADLQDSLDVMPEMVKKYLEGADIVCGVRKSRHSDGVLKRFTARCFYRLMNLCGAGLIYDHADYRLLSREAMRRLCLFHEDELFLRGMITRLELPLETVSYDRKERIAGESKYTLKKMMNLAENGLTDGKMIPQKTRRPFDERIEIRLID